LAERQATLDELFRGKMAQPIRSADDLACDGILFGELDGGDLDVAGLSAPPAGSEAPGGRLHDDLRALERDIDSHQNFIQTNSAPKDVVVGTDTAQVAADCESANPG